MPLIAALISSVAIAAAPQPQMETALASWYDTPGIGACDLGPDVQSGYRFASLFLRCGARVRFCRRGACVVATMADRGPYVSGRLFDLNVPLRDVLHCGGLCYVRWTTRWRRPPPAVGGLVAVGAVGELF